MDKIKDLFTAAENGDLDTIERIIIEAKDISLLESLNDENLTPLAAALYSGQADALQILINNGAKLNVPGRDGKTTLEWAREQDEDCETAAHLLLTDYMDRLYNTAVWWQKFEENLEKDKKKREEGHVALVPNCDACGCNINPNDSITLTLDEALSADKYTEKVLDHVIKMSPPKNKMDDREELKKVVIKQIRENSISSSYTVCDSCRDRFFSDTIFGKNKKFIIESIDKLFKDQL
jgi:ankyrin repeat protein